MGDNVPYVPEYLAVLRSRDFYHVLLVSSLISLCTGFLGWLSWNYASTSSLSFLPTLLVMTSAVMFVSSIMLFIGNAITEGIVVISLTVVQSMHVRTLISRLDQTVQVLEPVSTALDVFPAASRVSLAALVVQGLFHAYWCYAVSRAALMVSWIPMLAFLVFVCFWVNSVLRAWIHACVAGPMAAWLLLGASRMPRYPTASSVARATTRDAGSVCLHALVVPGARSVVALTEAPLIGVVFGFLRPLAAVLRDAFSPFALAHQAMYDKQLSVASTDANYALRLRKVDVLARRDLLATALFHLSLCGGMQC